MRNSRHAACDNQALSGLEYTADLPVACLGTSNGQIEIRSGENDRKYPANEGYALSIRRKPFFSKLCGRKEHHGQKTGLKPGLLPAEMIREKHRN